jgi:ParB-like chromosome segregation protein Spo0J
MALQKAKTENQIMIIQPRKIEYLIPYARNARTHSDEQVAQIAASIREFGWTNPILVDGENGIIAGHGRVLAARKLGMNEVPTIELSHLSDEQRRAYILADNKLALNAGWDNDLLSLELQELDSLGYNVDLTGFNAEDLEKLNDENTENDLPIDSSNKYLLMIEYDSEIALQRAYDDAMVKGLKCKLIQ